MPCPACRASRHARMRASDGFAGGGNKDSPPPKAETDSSGEGGSRPPATPAKFALVFFSDGRTDLRFLALPVRCSGV
eukprot:scaffold129699_cov48-Phaeocystis_antarctica.AAC.3